MMGIVIILICEDKPWEMGPLKKIQDFASYYGWWAGLINLVPLGILLVSAGRWTQPLTLSPTLEKFAAPRGFYVLVGAAMLACAGLGAVSLGDSLWDDEEYSLRRAVLGPYRRMDDGSVRLKEIPWSHTFWYYTKPTNHIFQSALSRLSNSAWRAVARPKALQFNEAALRLPSYIAGVLSVGAIAWLMLHAGFAWEGALAAWLLALHPWHMRLIPEARGYGLVLFLIPLCCIFAIRTLNSGKWRWWIALNAAEFALLYTWPPTLATLLVLNICILLRVVTDERLRPVRHILISRWLASGTITAVVLFQLMLPCIPQFREYMKNNMTFSAVEYWLKNAGSLFLTGSLWSKTGQKNPPYPETWPLADAHPILFGLVIFCALAAIAAGAARLWRKGPRGRGLTAVFLLPGLLMTSTAILQNTYIYEWYLAFMLPGLTALVATGMLGFVEIPARRTSLRWMPAASAAATIVVFFLLTINGRNFLLTRSAEPFRESVLMTRPNLDPHDPRNRKILTVSTVSTPEVYDPLVYRAASIDDYVKLMKLADEKDLPLYANNGFPLALQAKYPEVAAMLADEAVFEPVAHLYAIEEMLDRTVHKYRPGSVKTADFKRYSEATAAKVPGSIPLYY